jgi:predicted O-methyltransferase YrrM
MALVQRLGRYFTAWKDFHQIRTFGTENASVEQLVDNVFGFADGFFAPIQIREEIIEACKEIKALRPKYIVEVATAGGGTLLLWSRLAHPEATIITLDLPGGEFGGGSSYLRVPMFRRLGLPSQTIHLIRGDSHQPESLELTKRYLNGNPADYLFIDADHTADGVRADYAMYSPLVRTGGMIAFHDIAITRPEYGVRDLWNELVPKSKSREILGDPLAYGIGLLYR